MSIRKSDRIISVEHVSKYFGEKAVLNDVNLQVRKGEFVTILGPSGCGKTTLLRLIAGFQTASEGVITMSGKEITQTPPHKRPVNTVFQKYALFPHLNVYNNIAFGLKLKKLPSATIEKKVKQDIQGILPDHFIFFHRGVLEMIMILPIIRGLDTEIILDLFRRRSGQDHRE